MLELAKRDRNPSPFSIATVYCLNWNNRKTLYCPLADQDPILFRSTSSFDYEIERGGVK